jgi:hypothetical protein
MRFHANNDNDDPRLGLKTALHRHAAVFSLIYAVSTRIVSFRDDLARPRMHVLRQAECPMNGSVSGGHSAGSTALR